MREKKGEDKKEKGIRYELGEGGMEVRERNGSKSKIEMTDILQEIMNC